MRTTRRGAVPEGLIPVGDAGPAPDAGANEGAQPQNPAWPTLTPEEVQHIKDNGLNKGMPIYQVDLAGQTYVIRALAGAEWVELTRQILKQEEQAPVDPAQQDEMICDLGVVWPALPADPMARMQFWAHNLAGTPRSLVLQIRQKSGFPLTNDDGTIVGDGLAVRAIDPEPGEAPEEPSGDQIEEMRKTSPNRVVHRAQFPRYGGVHYFRPWNRSEWEQIRLQEDRGQDARHFAVRLALLWSSLDWDGPVLAGTVEQLFEQIFTASAFTLTPTVTAL